MIKSLMIKKDGSLETDFNKISIKDCLKQDDTLLWVDMYNPTDREIGLLSEEFRFHELAIEDCIFPQYLPKIDDFEDYVFIILHSVDSETTNEPEADDEPKELKTLELDIFFGRNFLVSVHYDYLKPVDSLIERCEQKPLILTKGIDFLLYSILDVMVDSYFPVLDRIDDRVNHLEDEILQTPSKDTMNKIFTLKRNILSVRKLIEPQRSIIRMLIARDIPFIKPTSVIYFRDVYDHLVRINDTINTYQEIATGVLESYLSSISNKLNEVIKVLTIITTMIMPLTLITSYYGMNLEFAEQGWGPWGLRFVWLVMVGVVGSMLLFFRHKKWI